MTTLRFAFPTDIRFGVGARIGLADALDRLGVRRPLVVTNLSTVPEKFNRMAWTVAFADGCHLNNPVVVTEADFDAIFAKAMA